MVSGRINKSKRNRSGILTPPSQNVLANRPVQYPLDIYNYTYLGAAFYSFRADWDDAFENINDKIAKPGDRIKRWKNLYMGGWGDAQVPKPSWGGGMFPPLMDSYMYDLPGPDYLHGFPTLIERTYDGKAHRGLEFLGPQYLQIEGSEIKDAYGVQSFQPMYSTGGTSIMGGPYRDSGATFLFVIDNYPIPDNLYSAWAPPLPIPPWFQGRKNALETLFLSKQPGENVVGMQGPEICVSGAFAGWQCYAWPRTEDLGVQFFTQGNAWEFDNSLGSNGWVCWGPDAASKQPDWPGPTWNVYNRNPLSNYPNVDSVNHSLNGHFKPYPLGSPVGLNQVLPTGLQAIILEYNNLEKTTYTTSIHNPTTMTATGPTVSLYAIGEGWATGDLDIPKWRAPHPAAVDHILWDDSNVFIGGCPPYKGSSDFTNDYIDAYWAGFTGTIFEIQMFEGVLNDSDKRSLGREYVTRFGSRME